MLPLQSLNQAITARRATRLLLFTLLLATLVSIKSLAAKSAVSAAQAVPGYGSTPAPPGPVDFGDVEVSTTITTSIEIFETGTDDLYVASPLLWGDNPGDFGLTTAFPLTIQDGAASETVNLSCIPQKPGLRTAKLTFTTNDPAQPTVTYTLTCYGYIVLIPGPVEAVAEGPYALAVNPNGDYLYVTTLVGDDDLLRVYRRDKTSGELSHVISYGTSELIDPNGVAASPEGDQVFVTSYGGDALFIMNQNPSTGIVTFFDKIKDGDLIPCSTPPLYVCALEGLDGANGLAVSPDGKNIYVAATEDDALTVFSRAMPTGTVSYLQDWQETDLGVTGLDGAVDVAVSPDGYHVYVVSAPSPSPGGGGAVAVFSRNPWNNGRLTFVTAYKDGGDLLLDRPVAVAVSPDGSQVYVASFHDDTLMVFDRNPGNGTLTVAQSLTDGGELDGLDGAAGVAVNPNGSQLYVASSEDNALAVFEPIPASGDWGLAAVYKDGVNGIDGLWWASQVATSPEGRHVYVTGYNDNAVALFRTLDRVYLPLVLKGIGG
jgi:DNA-binding beta-propeller fold protein YncE